MRFDFLLRVAIVLGHLPWAKADEGDSGYEQLISRAATWESSQRATLDLSFYNVPGNYSPDLGPGSLLKLEAATNLTNYTVPAGLTMSRLLYTTTDLNGTVIPASAFILWPFHPLEPPACESKSDIECGKQNSTSFPLVGWAYGTSGTLGNCAPSNYRSLQYHFQVPYALALQGLTVVAPDYAGIGVSHLPNGTRIVHPWLSGPAQAADLAFAIRAARAAFPSVLTEDGPFVAMGHSQGGMAAWSFAERMAVEKLKLKGYRGTVAIAPPTRVLDSIDQVLRNSSLPWAPALLGIQNLLMQGVSSLYPHYDMAGLTTEGRLRWDALVRAGGCLAAKSIAGTGLAPTKVAHTNWTEDYFVQQWQNRTATGRKPFAGPLLVLGGEADSMVPADDLDRAVSDTCDKFSEKQSLELVLYEGLNHFPLVQGSQQKWMNWIKARMWDGIEASGVAKLGCKKSKVVGIRQNISLKGVFANFLLTAAEPGAQSWQYAL